MKYKKAKNQRDEFDNKFIELFRKTRNSLNMNKKRSKPDYKAKEKEYRENPENKAKAKEFKGN